MSAGRTPRTARIFPSSASSPKIVVCIKGACGRVCCAMRSASAIDKSKPEPLFGNHAGESETVTFLLGQASLLFISAARTRSRDSESAASGRPKSEKPGIPSAISTSISTTLPVSPSSATDSVRPILIKLPHGIQGYVNHQR